MSTVRNPLTVIQVIDASYTKLLDKPILDTDNSSSLPFSSNEEINGTIKLHKVSKTGASTDLVDSNTLVRQTEFSALNTRVGTAETKITTIEGKIPTAASAQNQLADKQYVIDTFQNSMGTFKGSWNTWSVVPSSGNAYPPNFDETSMPHANDYMVILDASGYNSTNKGTWRFKYNGVWSINGKSGWSPEYQINEEPMTQAQLDAINSGITSELVTQIGTNRTNIADLMPRMTTAENNITSLGNSIDAVDDKADANASAIISINSDISSLKTRMTTAENNITSLGNSIDAVDDKVDTNTGNISGLTTRMTTAEGNITTISGDVSSLKTRMTTAEGNISAIPNNYVKFSAAQTLTNEQKSQARTNIGAGTSNFDGSYNNLTNKPVLNTNNSTNLGTAEAETVSGTINLHKISKTGTSTDLVDSSDLIRTSQFNTLSLRVTTTENNITSIAGKIPTEASSTNKLADKDFVNSSINALAAYYITKNAAGDPFATKAELTAATVFYSGGVARVPTTNDYCIVLADESKQSATGVDPTTRYSYQGSQWEYQYTLNNTPLTAAQLAALNSGITSTLVGKITTNESNITSLDGRLDTVESNITSLDGRLDIVETAVSQAYVKPNSGIPLNDLSSSVQTSLGLADSALQSISSSMITTALGYTPYNSTNPNGYTKVEASSTNGNIKINGTETTVYTLPNTVATVSQVNAKYTKPSGGIPASDLAESYYLANNPNGYTKVEASSTNGNIKINGTETTVYTLPSNIPTLTNGKLPLSVIPASAITETYVATSQAEMLALSNATVGDVCIRTDINTTFILQSDPYSTLANWKELVSPNAVSSVNGKVGVVTLTASDVKAVDYNSANQGLTNTQKSNARTNINAQEVISDISTIRSQAGSALQPNDNISELTNDSGYITGVTSSMITTALGYTPYNSTNPNGYQTSSEVITIVNNRAVRYDTASQGLTSTQQANARTNIGAGTSNFDGAYSSLSGLPTLGTAASKDTGVASGNVPVIDSNGKLPSSIIPVVQITVDSSLSATSTNPVQNAVITNTLSNKMDKTNPVGTGTFSMNRLANSTIGNYSATVGYDNTASGSDSFAEGTTTIASGSVSHSEGASSAASGFASHSEGSFTIASGRYSHVEGIRTIAQRQSQHVFGEYNIADTTGSSGIRKGEFIEIVGNGTDVNNRSNARTLDWNGNETLAGWLTMGSNSYKAVAYDPNSVSTTEQTLLDNYYNKSQTYSQSEVNTLLANKVTKATLLWTNPNPSSNFSAQTVTVNGLSNYDFIIISYKERATYSYPALTRIIKYSNGVTFPLETMGWSTFRLRDCTINGNSIVFQQANQITYANGNGTQANGFDIPYYIYGFNIL